MPVLAQRIKLFAGDVLPGIESQSFRTNANPLAGTDFTPRVVIILRQMLDELPLRTCQFFMGDGAKHTKRRYQCPGRVLHGSHTIG